MVGAERVGCARGMLLRRGTLGIVGLAIMLWGGLSWADGPPNPTASDGLDNTAGGSFALIDNTTGSANTGFGSGTLRGNTTGYDNTAFGADALYYNTTGVTNTGFGVGALFSNSVGYENTAIGAYALLSNTTGINNTAGGTYALLSNTTGYYNTAFGYSALNGNTTGYYNMAFGFNALVNNTTGHVNFASGGDALYSNTTGGNNTASGNGALFSNTTGDANTALGSSALFNNTTGSFNTAVGYSADVGRGNYTNSTALGYGAIATASNSIVLGNSSISKIYAKITTITAISDGRRKKDIRALSSDLGLDFVEKLKPVAYRFNDGDETERYGFIAQDVERALPASLHDMIAKSEPDHGLALIERQNDKDRTYRISYGELLAPIVKSIQEQQQEIKAERQQNADLRQDLETLTAAFRAENDALRRSVDDLRDQVRRAKAGARSSFPLKTIGSTSDASDPDL